MKMILLYVGKTDEKYLSEGIAKYIDRIKRYVNVEEVVIPSLKNAQSLPVSEQKKIEGELILKKVGDSKGKMYLLDEKGKSYSSPDLAKFIQKNMNEGMKNIYWVIGGPYGFSEEVYKKASGLISLSAMTFSHQMVRLFLAEQLYRAFTIIRNESYHHS